MTIDQTARLAAAKPIGLSETQKAAISVVGLGYVGAVSCACLTELGHRVIGVDIDERKLSQIAEGKSPIHEHELEALLSKGVKEGLLTATIDLEQAVVDTEVTFVSVGTPTDANGGCDFSYIEAAAESIGRGLARKSGYHVIVMRCSVPPGSTVQVMAPIIKELSGRDVGVGFGLCFNPEFLREGVAVEDFRRPPQTVIGATDDRAAGILAHIFAPVDPAPIICDVEEAEMVKYVSNVWHAAKVSFANEIGRLSKSYGVDGYNVMRIFSRDRKLNISDYYLKPGFAYGGSCLPKEVRAVSHLAKAKGVDLPMIDSLGLTNRRHVEETIAAVRASGAQRVAVLGLAFKRGTDDLRESPVLEVMAALQLDGVELRAHDAAINAETDIAGQLAYVQHGSGGLKRLSARLSEILCDDLEHAVEGADAIIVAHRDPIYAQLVSQLNGPKVFDLVRLFDVAPSSPNYDGVCW